MEALKNLVANVPDWLKKLNELSGQIEQRQIELAKLTEENKASSPDGSSSTATKSVRNKGSTESLKARDEPEAHPTDPIESDAADNAADTDAAAAAGAAAAKANAEQQQPAAPASPSHSQSPSALQRQASQMRAAGQARARATLRKRQRSDSVISADGAAPKYRTRSMIIVYYDSYVQMFFEELVKFVSASRNMMRKAKMAAKVAKIKRLAELESPTDDDDAEDIPSPRGGSGGLGAGDAPIAAAPSRDAEEELEAAPPLQYVSTRRLGPSALMMSRGMYARAGGRGPNPASMMGAGANPAAPDVYDDLDKGLEYVQSMCEHAAHQFLRDGECSEEVANIKRRLGETKELADKEMQRVQREDPQALLKAGGDDDGMHGRSYRPQSMRRDAMPKAELKAGPLEVDEGGEEEELPKLVYKSTRMMR
ncbi:hypothetical protein C8A05DRAFT_17118 [Staphylotrichum tortipilum]|uniref:Uncharacterized protein n=1 Tax=Staphylotrichum tortipilum TaxID=2831512 RepID=A0AAN6RRY5_9PEZI|nr:hypothetical protein C8A05DRAFT_17118 [Staphylotrichum longicolle]